MTIHVAPLRIEDHARWIVLARGYKTFYKTTLEDTEYDKAWQRLLAQEDVFGLGATRDGQLLGIAHYLFHTSVWAQNVCYLQDLFVDPLARGQGVARALIEAISQDFEGTRRHALLLAHAGTKRERSCVVRQGGEVQWV